MAVTAASRTGDEKYEAILAGIRDHRPQLEAAATEAEEQRTLPETSVQILRELGVFWLKTPAELGGTPIEPLQFADIIEELAYVDASAAWAAMIGAGCTGLVSGWIPDAGAKEMFGGPTMPIVAGQPRPRGIGREVEGGYVVRGRWSFSSGIRHANWLIGSFHVEGDEDGPGLVFSVPKEQAEVIDNWYVAGLQGTGSCDYSLTDVYIPFERTYNRANAVPARGGALYRQDHLTFVGNELPPFCIGMTRRALDDMVAVAGSTSRGFTGLALGDRAVFHKELAMAEVHWRSASLVYRDAIEGAWEFAQRGEETPPRVALAVATAQAYVAETCADVVYGLFRYGGGRVLASSGPMQRHLRNALAVRQHVAATEEHYELAGRELLARAGGAAPVKVPRVQQ